MLTFETLELRQLLAGDVSVIHDPFPDALPGDQVERVIRVFADEATDVSIVSQLSNELDDPTWTRIAGRHLRGFEEEYLSSQTRDFRLSLGAESEFPRSSWRFRNENFLRELGDIDGDGKEDAIVYFKKQPGSEFLSTVIFGGTGRDVVLDSPEINQGVALNDSFQFNALGDINADGFDDWSAGNRIIFGSARFGEDENPLENSMVLGDVARVFGIGDLNGDGIDDFVATCPTPDRPDYCPGSFRHPTFLLFGRRTLSEADQVLKAASLVQDNFGVVIPEFETHLASTAGDFNGDGLGDAVLVPDVANYWSAPSLQCGEACAPIVLYGSSTGDFSTVTLDGYSTLTSEVNSGAHRWRNERTRLYDLVGAEDLNGDGFDDVVLGFDGGTSECGCVPVSTLDDRVWAAGSVIIYGGPATDSSTPYRPDPDENTNILLPVLYPNDRPTTRLTDVNRDGTQDLHLVAGTTNFVIFARAGIESVDLGQVEFPTTELDPLAGVGFRANAPTRIQASTLWDINADGAVDTIVRVDGGFDVYLGEGSAPVPGNGDINEIVAVPDSSYILYRATGTLKANPTPVFSVVLASDLQESPAQLRNNFVAERAGALVGVTVSKPRRDGVEIEFDISLSNQGPGRRITDLEISESISNSLTNVTWSITSPPPGPGQNIEIQRGLLEDTIARLDRGKTQVYTIRGLVPNDLSLLKGEILVTLTDDFFDLRTRSSQVRVDADIPVLNTSAAFADLDQDWDVDFTDFLILSANFGRTEEVDQEDGDVNEDGAIDFADFLLFSQAWQSVTN